MTKPPPIPSTARPVQPPPIPRRSPKPPAIPPATVKWFFRVAMIVAGILVLIGVRGAMRTSNATNRILADARTKPWRITQDPSPPTSPIVPFATQVVSHVSIKRLSWEAGGFGTVMVATFTIQNENDFPVKDIVVQCSLFGNSDTKLGGAKKTLYEIIPKNSKKTFRAVNMGFVRDQAAKASCAVMGADY